MTAFGPDFSGALCLGASSLGVPVEWPLAALCLEGDGMNPYAANASGARGMWQRMPDQLYQGGRPWTLAVDAPAPPGCVLRNVRDAAGVVVGHTVWRLYLVTDPVQQLNDYFAWTRDRLHDGKVGRLKSREALYCCNLAPARLAGGAYDDETVLYSMRREDGNAYFPAGYQQNAAPFGLDAKDPAGRLQMKHLAHGLDAAVARHRAKFDAELAAAREVEAAQPAREYAENLQAAAVIERERPA